MQRYKRHLSEKETQRKELFLKEHPQEGVLLYDCLMELERVAKKYADELHVKLFGEEYDFMYDDGVDVNRRSKGVNPMGEEYQLKVNLKRVSMGFLPLAKNGMPEDGHKTQEYCKKMVLSLLCDNTNQ